MRAFVALAVPQDVQNALVAQVESLRVRLSAARWSFPADLHITLQFLGELSPGQQDALSAGLREVRSMPFDVDVTGLSTFSGAGVLYAAVQPAPELLALARAVNAVAEQYGVVPEIRPYRPHITLARTRRALDPEIATTPTQPWQALHWRATSFTLFRSQAPAAAGEPRYKVLQSYALIDAPARP